MSQQKLSVLLVMEQCNPDWFSVPLVGWNLYRHLAREADITLVTHERNREAIRNQPAYGRTVFIEESVGVKRWFRRVNRLSNAGGVNWPLKHALTYPIFAEFNRRVTERFAGEVEAGAYDIVMATTPILPRYPYSIRKACRHTPFILGPVNGGIPFPAGFPEIARREFAHFNFLRSLGKWLPGYRETYREADCILAGSTWTRDWIQRTFQIPGDRLALVWENGVDASFFRYGPPPILQKGPLNLLFAGRLVPYKGADMLIDAISRLRPETRKDLRLRIVGDGPEAPALQRRIQRLNLHKQIELVGKVESARMPDYYREADLFCFPSIREFGGAVAMEAMASGCPCIVANNGGIGEYVDDNSGIRINPENRESLVAGFQAAIEDLYQNPERRNRLARGAWMRAQQFTWSAKARTIFQIMEKVVANRKTHCPVAA